MFPTTNQTYAQQFILDRINEKNDSALSGSYEAHEDSYADYSDESYGDYGDYY